MFVVAKSNNSDVPPRGKMKQLPLHLLIQIQIQNPVSRIRHLQKSPTRVYVCVCV